VATGAGDDATVLRLPGGGFQVLSTDHLRAIVADPARMTRIAAVHALGDVFAMGATPQIALASIVLPRMSDALQRRSLEEITAAATGVFREVGAQLTGGHTTMGAELTIGFAVTGTTDGPPVTVAGAQPCDLLLLTRPIGSGVIMAATMQGRAPGRVTEAALSAMERPQHREAAILSSAHAMTDVTGFGLCGHVQAICRASGLRATLRRQDIPIYDGARELSAQGVASALLPANMADAPVSGTPDPLLHDPQTAGGLLAALAPDAARDALARLEADGLSGWIIGALEEGEGPIRIS
ncbi:selenide, water dikinase SelD, partial [Sulfitobacter sp. HI0129]